MKNILFNGTLYPCAVWGSELGNIGPCSFDSETTLIESGLTPDFIIGTAYNGATVYFITRMELPAFIEAHRDAQLYFANAAFDITVAEKLCGPLWHLFESGNVVDILLLKQLVELASTGVNDPRWSLDKLARKYLGVELPKNLQDKDGNNVRTSFSRFFHQDDRTVSYDEIPWDYLSYAGIDAIATYQIAIQLLPDAIAACRKHSVSASDLLSHQIQLKASRAFASLTKLGLGIDLNRVAGAREEICLRVEHASKHLRAHGWEPGGADNSLREIMAKLAEEHGIALPQTETGKLCVRADVLADYKKIPFIQHYLAYAKDIKLLQFLRFDSDRIYPRFGTLVATGRSSSYSPNVQQLPRDGLVRSVFVPAAGHVFLGIDYSQIELRTLAQITFQKFGFSRMRDLLNDRVDLHRFFASSMTGKSIHEIDDDERNKAKACNFGFPGGLGLASFIDYAKTNYGFELSQEEANLRRNRWLETFPEVKKYLEHDEMESLVDSDLLTKYGDYPGDIGDSIAAWVFRGIVCGQRQTKSSKRNYTDDEIEWAFTILERSLFPNKDDHAAAIAKRQGSWRLWESFSRSLNSIVLPSGRVRSWLRYTECKNNPFQGLAADGAKDALYELVKAGYRVADFIHDEYLIEIPLASDLRAENAKVSSILIDAMARHCPDVEIEVESCWMMRWQKKGTHVLDDNGRLVARSK